MKKVKLALDSRELEESCILISDVDENKIYSFYDRDKGVIYKLSKISNNKWKFIDIKVPFSPTTSFKTMKECIINSINKDIFEFENRKYFQRWRNRFGSEGIIAQFVPYKFDIDQEVIHTRFSGDFKIVDREVHEGHNFYVIDNTKIKNDIHKDVIEMDLRNSP